MQEINLKPRQYSQTKRVLLTALHQDHAPVLDFIKGKFLTGDRPDIASADDAASVNPAAAQSPISGHLHHWTLTTKYYEASLVLWLDHILFPGSPGAAEPAESATATAAEWAGTFSAAEAAPVRAALGAWIVTVPAPQSAVHAARTSGAVRALGALVDALELEQGGPGEVPVLAVMLRAAAEQAEASTDGEAVFGIEEAARARAAVEEECGLAGFEFVDGMVERAGRNKDGELEGIPRVLEALQTVDWQLPGEDTDGDGGGDAWLGEEGASADGFGDERRPVNLDARIPDLLRALGGLSQGGEDEFGGFVGAPAVAGAENVDEEEQRQVDELERMIEKLVSEREKGGPAEQLSKERLGELREMMAKVLLQEEGSSDGEGV